MDFPQDVDNKDLVSVDLLISDIPLYYPFFTGKSLGVFDVSYFLILVEILDLSTVSMIALSTDQCLAYRPHILWITSLFNTVFLSLSNIL